MSNENQIGILRNIWGIGAGRFDGWAVLTYCFVSNLRSDIQTQVGALGTNLGVVLSNCWLGPGAGVGAGAVITTGSVGALPGGLSVFAITSTANEVVLDGDFVVAPACITNILGGVLIGTTYWGPSTLPVPQLTSTGAGFVTVTLSNGAFYATCALWGPATLDVHTGGEVHYTAPATVCFLQTGGILLEGATTAVTRNGTAFAVGIALTPANLDKSVGAGGFGGLALGNTALTKIAVIV